MIHFLLITRPSLLSKLQCEVGPLLHGCHLTMIKQIWQIFEVYFLPLISRFPHSIKKVSFVVTLQTSPFGIGPLLVLMYSCLTFLFEKVGPRSSDFERIPERVKPLVAHKEISAFHPSSRGLRSLLELSYESLSLVVVVSVELSLVY